MVDFEGLEDKAQGLATEHSDQVDGGIDKAAGAAGEHFGHDKEIGEGAEKLEGLIPGEDKKD